MTKGGILLLLFSASSCGGEAEGGSKNGGGASSSTASGTGTGTGTGSGSGSGSGSGTKLPACVPGFDPRKEPRPCAWIGDHLCYDSKTAACACVCPRDRANSLCLSDFENGPDGQVEVFCN